jgi:hypothetical protein
VPGLSLAAPPTGSVPKKITMIPLSDATKTLNTIRFFSKLDWREMKRSAPLKDKEEAGIRVLDRDEFRNMIETYAASGNALFVVIADHLDQKKSSVAKFLSKSSRPRIVAIAFFGTKSSMRAACEKVRDIRYSIVVDRATGFIRLNASGMKSGFTAPLPSEDVQAYIKYLNQERFAGYDNWRLPTIEEVKALFKPEAQSQELYINPGFDANWTWNWCGNADQDESGAEWDVAFDVAA